MHGTAKLPHKLLQLSLKSKDRGTLPTPGIIINIPIPIIRGCVFLHPTQPNGPLFSVDLTTKLKKLRNLRTILRQCIYD